MDTPQLQHVPTTKTGMLIRRPADEVFEAFIDPEVTTKFWFTRERSAAGRCAGSVGLGDV
jgi:uncharacterized protein YndB with AHSA1/START domain